MGIVRVVIVLCFAFLAACGGGGSGASSSPGTVSTPPPPPPPPPSAEPTSIDLYSDPGDYIGGGRDYSYTNTDAQITVTATGARLTITISGDESWHADFQLPNTYTQLETGTYNNLTRYPFHDPAMGGLSWHGEGRGCNTLVGMFTINEVTYNGTTLASVDLQFEQYCEGGSAALRGDIHWDADDTTTIPGPAASPPAGLWAPAAGVVPATGNYVYLDSQAGDWVGAGLEYLYTNSTAAITVNTGNAHLSVSVDGNENWSGDFQAMNSISYLEAGYYGDLRRYPFHNPVKGGLSWSGEGRGCNTLSGWFMVDSVTYNGNTLSAIDLRFEQHCDGGPALNGAIHWDVNDTTGAAGPVVPPPANLWEPTPGITPAAGNYVYLESDFGDWVGLGVNYLYTLEDSLITVSTSGARLNVDIDGDENWGGNFQAMNSLVRLEVGYYGDLQRYPFHNPVKGGLSWSGEGRGCNTLTGWFVIDSLTYDGDNLTAIDLRFEQHCDGGPALNGEIHWDANDATMPPGPVVPPPAGLWEPAPGVTPASGNYVYLESDFGDWVGQGANYLYTGVDSTISVSTSGATLDVNVDGDENWRGSFQPMISVTRLEVGYYGNLKRYPFHNPVKGGLSWSGESRGCNTLSGWFVVDSVTYNGNALTAIDLRFEQHCDGGPALNGEIHWDVNDTTSAPGPVVPPPVGLWEPPPGITPATGNYVYLESDVGDWVGGGANYLYTDADSQISIAAPGARLEVGINGAEYWNGIFQGMNSLNYLEVGYYGDLQRYPFHNAVKGGLSWTGQSRGCNTLTGWFVIDSVAYTGVTLTAIDLRFEQHCDGGPALNGKIHWSQP